MSLDYHGPKPVTKDDQKIAKKHLKETIKVQKDVVKLQESKIKDHQKAAEKTDNPQSKSYNLGHIPPHQKDKAKAQKDITDRQRSLQTLKKLKPAVIMPVKKSSGLSNYLTKKKMGAKALARST